jgi:ABC-2 type transport system ATP-binding protein
LITRWSRDAHRTVFLCTHNLVEAQRLCDRIGVMEQGRLIAIGKTAELARSAGLSVRLEIEVAADGLSAAQQVIQTRFAGISVMTENSRLYLTGSRYDQIPDIIAALVTAQVRIYRVDQQEASLEDIYFALHQKEVSV